MYQRRATRQSSASALIITPACLLVDMFDRQVAVEHYKRQCVQLYGTKFTWR